MATILMEAKSHSTPRSLGRALNFAAGTGSAVAQKLLEPHGLTLAQWAILSSIWRNGDLSIKELASMTGNAPPAVSRIVDRMVTAKLLVRTQNEVDRRGVTVGLTEASEALRPLQILYEDVNAILMADLSDHEQAQLFALLEKVQTRGRAWLET